MLSIAALWPYLLYLWAIWHLVRLLSREPPHNELSGGVFIGRRLLRRELPPDVDVVVDLTCEFAEPRGIRNVRCYISCPILDASSIDSQTLIDLVHDLASTQGGMFIHCAQGHGRTGLVAALFLIRTKQAVSVDDALAAVKSVRPLVSLNRQQLAVLKQAAEVISDGDARQQ